MAVCPLGTLLLSNSHAAHQMNGDRQVAERSSIDRTNVTVRVRTTSEQEAALLTPDALPAEKISSAVPSISVSAPAPMRARADNNTAPLALVRCVVVRWRACSVHAPMRRLALDSAHASAAGAPCHVRLGSDIAADRRASACLVSRSPSRIDARRSASCDRVAATGHLIANKQFGWAIATTSRSHYRSRISPYTSSRLPCEPAPDGD